MHGEPYDSRDYPPDDPFFTAPTEPVIVCCKDCVYGEDCVPPCDDRYCVMYDQRHPGWWYCADGEKELRYSMKEKPECTKDYEQKQLIMSDNKCKQCEYYYTCRFIMMDTEAVINGD